MSALSFLAGPWKGVRTTTDPFDDTPDYLVDAANCYIPDPEGGSGLNARPGFELCTTTPLGSGGVNGCGHYTHVALDGTRTTFAASGGRLYRLSADLKTQTDVTPASGFGAGAGTRVFMVSFNDSLIVTDQVHKPWFVPSAGLTATPLVPTTIEWTTPGTAWSASHLTVYGGALFFLLTGSATIVWSEIEDQTTGYQQTNFDNVWSLVQTEATPIYAIWGTNTALLYFRQATIGTIAGPVGPNLQSTATHDALAYNIGTTAPASIASYGDSIFFVDALGRPQMLRPGLPPLPIWLNLRSVVEQAETSFPIANGQVMTGAVEPNLNLYVVAVWSSDPLDFFRPSTIVVFDAKTGAYVGRWPIASRPGVPLTVCAIAVVANSDTGGLELVINGAEGGITGGNLWRLRQLSENVWTDNGQVPVISATTQRLGYSANRVLHADQATIIAGSDAACTVTTVATGTPSTLEGTPSPQTSQDGTYRLVCGLDAVGRGIEVTVSPTTAASQWSLEQVQLLASASTAGPNDP